MYGLIGKKLGHSYSAEFFNKKFKNEGLDETYRLFPLNSINQLSDLLTEYPDLKGFNVTIPYKEQIIPFLNYISVESVKIGAVNVVKVNKKNGERFLEGYNTDCIGFRNSLVPLLRPEIKNALILGSGGASKAVDYVLTQLGISVTIVSRNPGKNQLNYSDLTKKIIDKNLLIVNTTPLGMFPNIQTYPPIPYHFLTGRHVCYDLVYNPQETEFMKLAKKYGATIKNGYEMLIGQALASWDIWCR